MEFGNRHSQCPVQSPLAPASLECSSDSLRAELVEKVPNAKVKPPPAAEAWFTTDPDPAVGMNDLLRRAPAQPAPRLAKPHKVHHAYGETDRRAHDPERDAVARKVGHNRHERHTASDVNSRDRRKDCST